MRSRVRRVGGHLVAAAGGVIFALLLVEVGLRVAAVFAARAAREHLGNEDPEGRPVVAFVGDSNIYGVYVEADETLPKAVERLSRCKGGGGVTCVNLGVPGAASWNAVEQTRRALALRPRAIVATVGFNNFRSAAPSAGLGSIEQLRIVKALRLALFYRRVQKMRNANGVQTMPLGPRGAKVETGGATGFLRGANLTKPRDGEASPFEMTFRAAAAFEEIAPRLASDLREMASLARHHGAALVLATYLAGLEDPYIGIRNLALSLQGDLAISVADTAALLPRAMQGDDPRPIASWSAERFQARRSLFLFRDTHPTALGYEFEARVVVRTLHDIGVLSDCAVEDPLSVVRAVDVALPALRQVGDAPVAFEVEGMPRDHVVILLGRPGTSVWNGVRLPLDYLHLVDEGLVGSMTAEVDAGGRARIEVPPAVRARVDGGVWAVGVVERAGSGAAAQTLLTPAITVSLGS